MQDSNDDFLSGGVPGEVDLMKLVVNVPTNYQPGTSLLLSYPAESLALYSDTAKSQPVFTPLVPGELSLDLSGGARTLYVEVYGRPGSYFIYGSDVDVVRVNGIWATVTAVEHSTRAVADVFADSDWSGMPTAGVAATPRGGLEALGGTGLLPLGRTNPTNNQPWGVRNVILIRFNVSPFVPDPSVLIDITRRRESKAWAVDGTGTVIFRYDGPYSTGLDEANDDSLGDTDESDAPDGAGNMYVIDAPGLGTATTIGGAVSYMQRMNAEEFVRIVISDEFGRPIGNETVGSRASDKFDWHVRHQLDVVDGLWHRPDVGETEDNDIGPGHIDLGIIPAG